MDAEITKKIYARVPVLWKEGDPLENPWGIQFLRMFDMSSDSGAFRDSSRCDELVNRAPLYEAKMIHQFDHRWVTYSGTSDDARELSDAEKASAAFEVQPRYWIENSEVEERLAEKNWRKKWLIGFRDITNATNERTVIAGVIPRVGVGHTAPLILFSTESTPRTATSPASFAAIFLACMNSLILDYIARQKVGGTHLTYGFLRQFSFLPPSEYRSRDLEFIVPRVLELTYTANDLKPFYLDLLSENPGWDIRPESERGHPFLWNPSKRALLRAELDAYYAKLYGLTRDDLRYILEPTDVMGDGYPSETFRVMKEKEIRLFGEYRSRRLVLEAWDQLALSDQAAQ